MLSSRARLRARESSKPDALPREAYLDRLVKECANVSTSKSNKEQCLAHLANFGYDPINFNSFAKLNVFDMFVDFVEEALATSKNGICKSEHMTNVLRLSLQGICNMVPDPRFQQGISDNDAIPLILQGVHSQDGPTCAASLSILFFLLDAPVDVISKSKLQENEEILKLVKAFATSEDSIVRNTAQAYLSRRHEVMETS